MTKPKWESTQILIATNRARLRPYDAMEETNIFIPDRLIWDGVDNIINLLHTPIHLASQ